MHYDMYPETCGFLKMKIVARAIQAVFAVCPYVDYVWGRQSVSVDQVSLLQGRIDNVFEFAWAVAILLRTAKRNVESDYFFQTIHDIITIFSPCIIMHFQRQHLFLFLSVIHITSVHLIFYDCFYVFSRGFQNCHLFYKIHFMSRHCSKPVWNVLSTGAIFFFFLSSNTFIKEIHCWGLK